MNRKALLSYRKKRQGNAMRQLMHADKNQKIGHERLVVSPSFSSRPLGQREYGHL